MQDKNLTKSIVEDYLLEQDFKVSMKGFKYIVEAILMWDDHIQIYKDVYVYLAKKDYVTPAAIERNIRHSIASSNIEHITNREFIAHTKLMLLRRCE